jgi:hypothetical protein
VRLLPSFSPRANAAAEQGVCALTQNCACRLDVCVRLTTCCEQGCRHAAVRLWR